MTCFSLLCFLSILLLQPENFSPFSSTCIQTQLNLHSQIKSLPRTWRHTAANCTGVSLSLFSSCLSERSSVQCYCFVSSSSMVINPVFTLDLLEVLKKKVILGTHPQENRIRISEDKTWALLFSKIFPGDFDVY